MKTVLAIVLLSILCAGSAPAARAVCVGASVNSFGAKGDGVTDDTAAIQSALNAAGATGGGSVVFNVARYYTTGTLTVPANVVLCGSVEGPFDVAGGNPGLATIAPTILITSTAGPFLTLQGNSGVTDLLFHYPNQVASSAAAPMVYPYTIQVTGSGAGAKVARTTVTNAYNFLDIEVGSVRAQDLFIGAFNIGVNLVSQDHVTLRHLVNQVFWDILENATYPRPIDTWVLNNGVGLLVGEADLELHNFFVFSRFAGIQLNGTLAQSQNPPCPGGGMGSDIDLETVQYGITVNACPGPGFEFTNVDIVAAPGLGQAAVQVMKSGAGLVPKIAINGGSQRGPWALYAGGYPPPAADTIIVNILP